MLQIHMKKPQENPPVAVNDNDHPTKKSNFLVNNWSTKISLFFVVIKKATGLYGPVA
jgi:hypothetical protein